MGTKVQDGRWRLEHAPFLLQHRSGIRLVELGTHPLDLLESTNVDVGPVKPDS